MKSPLRCRLAGALLAVLKRVAPKRFRRIQWQWVYSNAQTPGPWHLDRVSQHVQQSFNEAWFLPNARLIDVGCGLGENAAWRAEQGMQVTGIDFSSAAIESARHQYSTTAGLQFHVADCTRPLPNLGTFDCALDRGCLHGLPTEQWPAWFENLHHLLRPSGRLLLLMAIRSTTEPELLQLVRRHAADRFHICHTEHIEMLETGDRGSLRGVLFRMTRL